MLAAGLRGALAPFREKPSDFDSAKVFASRLERRLGVAGRSMGSFELPGQYRRSADRWRAGTRTLPVESAHRLCRSDRCGIECWRRMECLGRYNYDHVVDCWCFARASVRGGDWRG